MKVEDAMRNDRSKRALYILKQTRRCERVAYHLSMLHLHQDYNKVDAHIKQNAQALTQHDRRLCAGQRKVGEGAQGTDPRWKNASCEHDVHTDNEASSEKVFG